MKMYLFKLVSLGFVPAQFILTVIANSGLRVGKDNSIMKKFNNNYYKACPLTCASFWKSKSLSQILYFMVLISLG